MEITTIKYFLSVAKCLNFSQAAEENHISQSSFSKAIMRLERDLDVKLIDRSSHPISLTSAGQYFYERMRELEPQFNQAIEGLERLVRGETIRVLICPKSYQYRLALDDFINQHNGIHIQLEQISDISKVVEQVRSGNCDFAITPKPFNLTEDVMSTTIYDDELYMLTADSSPYAEKERISLKELNGLDFYESPYSQYLLCELSRQFGLRPRKIYPQDGEEMRREECIHRITLNKGVGIYSGRDLAPYRTKRMHCVPVMEVPSLPVVLLEKKTHEDTAAQSRLRQWLLANLEAYITPRLQIEEFNRSNTKQ
ncbi:MAG: LysR family transcriptional regulator [Oscillospiraceae bacterium]|nr:LysR family transcriptional regulator [Oscillospiraceae bacterium]